jgi:polysaccharide export outer membrane protein
MRGKIIIVALTIGLFLLSSLCAPIGAKGDLDIVMELIERWKGRIERKGLGSYLARYGNPFRKAEGLKGERGRSQRVDITIEDMRFFEGDDGIITTTFLRRTKTGEFHDVGVGMLSFKGEDGSWKINGEKWYPLPEKAFPGGNAYTVTIGPGNSPRVIINDPGGKGPIREKTHEKRVTSRKEKPGNPDSGAYTIGANDPGGKGPIRGKTHKKRVTSRKEMPKNPDIGEYTIGAGDVLVINVWGHEDLTKEVVVSEKGKFSFPLIGELKAAGLTVKELEAKLVRLLSEGYVINPYVTVRVRGYKSKRVYVLGQVRSPGTYSLDKETSLIEIISRAGGVSDGAGWIIEVVRPSKKVLDKPITPDEANKEDIIRVDVEGLLGGRAEDNIRIEGGDTIFVPKAAFYFIFGEVKSPGSYKLRRETTVLKAVILAGGFTGKASKRRIKIRRKEGDKTIKVRVKLDDPVLPQDTIIVPESFF